MNVWENQSCDKCMWTKFTLVCTCNQGFVMIYDMSCATSKFSAKQTHTKVKSNLYPHNKDRYTIWKFLPLIVAPGNELVTELTCSFLFISDNAKLSTVFKQLQNTVTGIKRNLIRKINVRCHVQSLLHGFATGCDHSYIVKNCCIVIM